MKKKKRKKLKIHLRSLNWKSLSNKKKYAKTGKFSERQWDWMMKKKWSRRKKLIWPFFNFKLLTSVDWKSNPLTCESGYYLRLCISILTEAIQSKREYPGYYRYTSTWKWLFNYLITFCQLYCMCLLLSTFY